jgi:hypothetical protein
MTPVVLFYGICGGLLIAALQFAEYRFPLLEPLAGYIFQADA